jgi:hypothetical protein
VENAADTLPPTLNGDGDDGLGGSGSGIDVRGGVNGAPNMASNVDGTAGSGRRGVGGICSVFSSGGVAGSLLITGVNFGEKGGVRCRAGVGCWLGIDEGWSVGLADGGVAGARGAGDSARGIGGGHTGGGVWTGVRTRGALGLPPDPLPTPALACAGTGRSSPQVTAAPTGIRPPQIEHRARMETLVIFAGSSLKTDWHSGHETFIGSAGLAEFADLCAAVPA